MPRKGRAVARALQAGSVNVNEAYAATWGSVDAPMGGWKDSGVGSRHGEHGILKYTDAQTVSVQRLLPIAPPSFLPQDRVREGHDSRHADLAAPARPEVATGHPNRGPYAAAAGPSAH